jgi:hypothetical protein
VITYYGLPQDTVRNILTLTRPRKSLQIGV